MGDFNARVGQDNSGFERIMRKHGCGIMNEANHVTANIKVLLQLMRASEPCRVPRFDT